MQGFCLAAVLRCPVKSDVLIMKRTFYEAMIVILVSALLALVVNGLRPQGMRLFLSNTQPADEINKMGDTDNIKVISVAAAIEKFKAGTALFIDSRAPVAFSEGHIKGAVSLPEQQFDEWIDGFILKTDPQTEIITYCDSLKCPQARNLTEKLFLVGFERVLYMAQGFDKWNDSFKPEP